MLYEDTFLTVYILAVAVIFGAVMGSFINCMAWRIAHNESVLKGRSHCALCGHTLRAADLIPVFSYIFLRGKCRYCGEKISPRYMAVEIVMGLAFGAVVWKYGLTFMALRYLILVCLLMGLSLVDLEIYEIPDRFIVSGIIVWMATVPLVRYAGETLWQEAKGGLIGGLIIGGSMLVISLLFDKVTGKESLGGGDIKLFFMTGLYLGLGVGLFNLILACVVGIVFVIVMGQKKIPFGPAISIAVFVSIMAGREITGWYIGLF